MSNPASRHMRDDATVWPRIGVDDFGFPLFGDPYVIKCNFLEGGKLARDEKGDEFMPSSTIITLNSSPSKGDLIMLGDYSSSPTPEGSSAQKIRKRITVTAFLGRAQSISLLTGN